MQLLAALTVQIVRQATECGISIVTDGSGRNYALTQDGLADLCNPPIAPVNGPNDLLGMTIEQMNNRGLRSATHY
jgi:hypothetical protein